MGRLLAPLATVALAGCALLPDYAPFPGDAASLAAAEKAFAEQSVREGMRAAFLAWLAPEAMIYRDGPVNGPAYIAANPEPPITLDWRPVYVEVAASGELGLSTGPWTLTSRRDPSAPPRHGQFVSVWKRDAGGPWRVRLDLGISHPDASLAEAPLHALTTPSSGEKPTAALKDAEMQFSTLAARAGDARAYGALASPSVRLYRQGHAPFLGRAALLNSPAAGDSRTHWTLETHDASASGDLGYATGRYGPAWDGSPEGHYVRVWRREPDGWRIALDVTNARTPR